MMLCIDVGNTQIYGGVFQEDEIVLRFRHASRVSTSDEFGVFLKTVLRENQCDPAQIHAISICSVVPQIDYSIRSACIKYFSIEPFFLQASVNTGLNIHYNQPGDLGADRLANAIAATHQFPNQALIVIDFGTATTFCVIDAHKNYLGGVILPGIRSSVDALCRNTAKLPAVDIVKVDEVIGKSTTESIQSGVYYGAIGSCRELITRIKRVTFQEQSSLVLATGGFASFFDHCGLYDHLLPDLVLHGLRIAVDL